MFSEIRDIHAQYIHEYLFRAVIYLVERIKHSSVSLKSQFFDFKTLQHQESKIRNLLVRALNLLMACLTPDLHSTELLKHVSVLIETVFAFRQIDLLNFLLIGFHYTEWSIRPPSNTEIPHVWWLIQRYFPRNFENF